MQQFFEDNIVTRLHVTDKFELDSANLGKSKDQIDHSLTVNAAITLFGPFLRYHTRSAEQILPSVHNAFAVLMANQRELSKPGLPPPLSVH